MLPLNEKITERKLNIERYEGRHSSLAVFYIYSHAISINSKIL